MPLLLENEWFSISVDPEKRIVTTVRTDGPYTPDDAIIRRIEAEVEQAFGLIDRSRYGHLLDIRAAALNNSDDFEKRMAHLRGLLLRGFARVAVLVRTAVGALQSNRLTRQDGARLPASPPGIEVFTDEAAAIRFLIGAEALSSRSRPPSSTSR